MSPAADPDIDGVDCEQLRIATTMVGGSSLAIYMGGVALELGRLVAASSRRAADRGLYGALLDLTRTSARVDVITGTSAGGLNGACLALAQARGVDLSVLRQLWVEKGDFAKLLRPLGDAAPPSLLRGDDFFLPSLREALGELAEGTAQPDGFPLHLQMTIVSVGGVTRTYLDDFMTPIPNTEHLQWCTFVREPGLLAPEELDEIWRQRWPARIDDFSDERIAARLALAARSSASFPVAFEPSLIPVGRDADDLHPDMAHITSLPHSDWVLDGGVLMNQPVRPALRAIFRMPADQQVRRVLAFVVPDPSEGDQPRAPAKGQLPGEPPPASDILLRSLVTLPRVQSLGQELEEIRAHNRDVRTRRSARLDLLATLAQGEGSAESVFETLVRGLWPLYRTGHKRRLLELVVDQVERGIAEGADQAADIPLLDRLAAWNREVLTAALEPEISDWELPADHLPVGEGALETGPGWRWDLTAIDRVGAVVLDLLKWAVWLIAVRDDPTRPLAPDRLDALVEIQRLRGRLHTRLAAIRLLATVDGGYWRAQADEALAALVKAARGDHQAVRDWAREAVDGWPGPMPREDPKPEGDGGGGATGGPVRRRQRSGQARRLLAALQRRERTSPQGQPSPAEVFRRSLAEHAEAIARLVWDLRQALVATAPGSVDVPAAVAALLEAAPRVRPSDRDRAAEFAQLLETLTKVEAGTEPAAEVLRRLLGLQLVQQMTTGEDVLEQAVELVQVDANVASPFPGVPTGAEKLAGAKLGHFGAFYKRSWALNDWVWGRLDGAARLVEITLSPARLLQLGFSSDQAAAAVRELAVPPPGDRDLDDHDFLGGLWDEDANSGAIRRELAFLDDPSLPVPARLPRCAAAIARRMQIEVLREELPGLAAATALDRAGGAARTRAGMGLERLIPPATDGRTLRAETCVEAIKIYRVGAEDLLEEIGTDHFTTVASHAAVVASATVANGAKGLVLAPVRFAASAVRGTLLALALFARAAARRSATGFGVLVVLLATGAGITALSAFSENVPATVATIGAALFWAGILLALIRAGVIGFLQIVVPAGIAYALARWWFLREFDLRLSQPGGRALVVFALIVTAVLLGTVTVPGWPARMARAASSPNLQRPSAGPVLAFGLLLAVGAAAVFWAFVWPSLEPPPSGLGSVTDPGMVRLQLASESTATARVLVRWSELGVLGSARSQVTWDWLFIVLYSLGLFAACRGAGRLLASTGRVDSGRFGLEWSWMVLLAGLLDAVENALLLSMIGRAEQHAEEGVEALAAALPAAQPPLVGLAAAGKLALLAVAIAYLLRSLVVLVRRALSSAARSAT